MSLDSINGRSIQTLLRGENDSKQSDEFQANNLIASNMTSMPDLLYGLRNICCTTFHKLESLLFPFLFFINCLCNKIIRWDVASNSAPADNIKHTIYSDFWCAFKISTLSSLNDADYLFVCFYKMAIRRQLLAKGSATMNIPGQVALFPPPPGPGCRNNNMRWQSKKSIANWLIKMNIKKN